MPSGWPDQIWAPWQDNADPMTGMADFNRPKDPRVQYGINKGLPSDWRDTYKSTVGRSNAWDVIGTSEVAGNALFAAAAEAIGLDWDEWRAETMAALGDEEDFTAALEFVNSQDSPTNNINNPWATIIAGRDDDDWGDLTPDQIEIAQNLPTPQSGTGGQTSFPGIGVVGLDPDAPGGVLNQLTQGDGEDAPYDWGIGTGHSQISADLSEMQEWLEDVNKKAAERQADIIVGGPQLSDYNLEGDFDNIYEALGLTEAPGAPKELAVTFEGNYAQIQTSSTMYHKPSDRYADIELHDDKGTDNDILNWRHGNDSYRSTYQKGRTEGTWQASQASTNAIAAAGAGAGAIGAAINTKDPDRPYADYKGDGDKSDRHPDRQAKVDPEWRTKRRWTHNVKEIIGKDQDWKGWAEAAGVSKLNSRNDSDKIKKFYRENKGKMDFPNKD